MTVLFTVNEGQKLEAIGRRYEINPVFPAES